MKFMICRDDGTILESIQIHAPDLTALETQVVVKQVSELVDSHIQQEASILQIMSVVEYSEFSKGKSA